MELFMIERLFAIIFGHIVGAQTFSSYVVKHLPRP